MFVRVWKQVLCERRVRHRCDYRCEHIAWNLDKPRQHRAELALLIQRFPQDLRYLLDGHVIEASKWMNLFVLDRWRWSGCCRSTNGVKLPRENVLKSSSVWVTDVDATGRNNVFILFQSDLD